MSLQIQHFDAFFGFLAFTAAFMFFSLRMYLEDGLSDFSVGIEYKDFFLAIITLVPLAAATSHLFMSFGLGFMTVDGRTFAYLRHFEWAISTPLLIMGIAVLTQKSDLMIKATVLDVVMILTGFIAAATLRPVRIYAFVVSMLAFFGLLYYLLKGMNSAIEDRAPTLRELFTNLRNWTVVLWSLYPIFMLFSADGLGILNTASTMRGFLFLDMAAKIGYVYIVYRGFNDFPSNS